MDRRLAAALLVAGIVALSVPAWSARPLEQTYGFEVTAIPCEAQLVCLAYDGQIPGPTIDVRLGDTIVVTLTNRIEETLSTIPGVDAQTRERLAASAASFHIHGQAIPASMDGVDAHPGTRLVRSVAEPGGSFTYRMRAAFPGTWHYHDHVLGFDGGEGIARGLYGSVVVRNGGEPQPATVLDMHLLDAGVNGGRGLPGEVPAGAPFDVVVVGLDSAIWIVTFGDQTLVVGPGMSERIHVESASGTYAWEATGGLATSSGEVVAR